jgi:hypothetical protein
VKQSKIFSKLNPAFVSQKDDKGCVEVAVILKHKSENYLKLQIRGG